MYSYERSFTDHVARGEAPEITGEDGYKALKLCEAALQNSKTKQRVRVSDI
jgi:predicted dehydrogenase